MSEILSSCSNLGLNQKFILRNFHSLLEGENASSTDVMFLVESLRTHHHLKERPFYALFNEFIRYKDILEKDGVPCSKAIKNRLKKKMVGVTLTFEYRNKETGRAKTFKDMESIPRKKFDRHKWQLIYTVAKVILSGYFIGLNIN